MASGTVIDAGMLDYCIMDARAATRKPTGSAMMFQEAIAFLADENDRLRAERDALDQRATNMISAHRMVTSRLCDERDHFRAERDEVASALSRLIDPNAPRDVDVKSLLAKLRTP